MIKTMLGYFGRTILLGLWLLAHLLAGADIFPIEKATFCAVISAILLFTVILIYLYRKRKKNENDIYITY